MRKTPQHDNDALSRALAESSSVAPVYIFDPRDYGKSASGFDRTGPYRAHFVLDCVADLRAQLAARGSRLLLRVGRPEEVLAELAEATGAAAVYCHAEVTAEDIALEVRRPPPARCCRGYAPLLCTTR